MARIHVSDNVNAVLRQQTFFCINDLSSFSLTNSQASLHIHLEITTFLARTQKQTGRNGRRRF